MGTDDEGVAGEGGGRAAGCGGVGGGCLSQSVTRIDGLHTQCSWYTCTVKLQLAFHVDWLLTGVCSGAR